MALMRERVFLSGASARQSIPVSLSGGWPQVRESRILQAEQQRVQFPCSHRELVRPAAYVRTHSAFDPPVVLTLQTVTQSTCESHPYSQTTCLFMPPDMDFFYFFYMIIYFFTCLNSLTRSLRLYYVCHKYPFFLLHYTLAQHLGYVLL